MKNEQKITGKGRSLKRQIRTSEQLGIILTKRYTPLLLISTYFTLILTNQLNLLYFVRKSEMLQESRLSVTFAYNPSYLFF